MPSTTKVFSAKHKETDREIIEREEEAFRKRDFKLRQAQYPPRYCKSLALDFFFFFFSPISSILPLDITDVLFKIYIYILRIKRWRIKIALTTVENFKTKFSFIRNNRSPSTGDPIPEEINLLGENRVSLSNPFAFQFVLFPWIFQECNAFSPAVFR